jgi:hypothetical protein
MEERIQICSNEGDCPSPRGDSVKHGTNYPWVKGIEISSNEGPDPLQRGYNHKNVKMWWCHLDIFSKSKGPILSRLGTNHPWRECIQVCPNDGDCSSPGGDNSKE